jgi:hypothetical protein
MSVNNSNKAGVILFKRQGYSFLILTGTESSWLSDNKEIKDLETAPSVLPSDTPDLKSYFEKKVDELREKYGQIYQQIRYGQINPTTRSVKFIFKNKINGESNSESNSENKTNKVSIPKGGIEAIDNVLNGKSNAQNAAIREIREECGEVVGNYVATHISDDNRRTLDIQINYGNGNFNFFKIYFVEIINETDYNDIANAIIEHNSGNKVNYMIWNLKKWVIYLYPKSL